MYNLFTDNYCLTKIKYTIVAYKLEWKSSLAFNLDLRAFQEFPVYNKNVRSV